MKNLTRLFLGLFCGSFIVCSSAYADPSSAPATPVTPAAQDTKNQQNNPSGPAAQDTGTDPKKDSKKDSTTPTDKPTSTTIPGAPAATKTPQKDQETDKK